MLYSSTQKLLANGLLMKWLSLRISIHPSAFCCCSFSTVPVYCGASWPSNTRKSTQCGFSASFCAFSMSSGDECWCASPHFRSSCRTAHCSLVCRRPSSNRHAWTAFASPCYWRCTTRRTKTRWSGSLGWVSPASFRGPNRSGAAARAPSSASSVERSRSASGWKDTRLRRTKRANCVASRRLFRVRWS